MSSAWSHSQTLDLSIERCLVSQPEKTHQGFRRLGKQCGAHLEPWQWRSFNFELYSVSFLIRNCKIIPEYPTYYQQILFIDALLNSQIQYKYKNYFERRRRNEEREKDRLSICSFTAQMPAIVRARPGQSWDHGSPCGSFMLVMEIQGFELSAAAIRVYRQLEQKLSKLGFKPASPTQAAGVSGDRHCTKCLPLVHKF